MTNTQHKEDRDCTTIDPETNCCTECGVESTDECPICYQRSFHKQSCDRAEYV